MSVAKGEGGLSSKLEDLKKKVKENSESIDKSQVQNAAETAITDFTNSLETSVGSVAGQIEGGVQSLTSKFDKIQGIGDKLNNTTVEGLIDDGIESLENMGTEMVTEAIGALASKLGLGASVNVTFSEPDSNGFVFPIESSLEEDGGISGTISAILQLITGLGIDAGSLQKVVAEGSAEGILNAGKDLVSEKIGAFTAKGINGLAKDAIESVTDELVTQVTDAVNNGVAGSLNKAYEAITGFESDGSGGLSIIRSTVTGNMPDAIDELNAAVDKVKTKPLEDLGNLFTEAKQVKQNLKGAVNDLENLTGKDGNEVLKSVQNKDESIAKYTRIVDEKRTLVRTRVANGGETGIVQSLSTDTLTTIRSDITQFCDPNFISEEGITTVVNKSQGDSRDFNDAIKILEGITGKSYNVIKSFLKTIDTTISTATLEPPTAKVFEDPYVIGSFEKTWQKGKGDPVFPYISSVEELRADLRNVTRDVTEFVTHWTETPTNKNIGSEEINKIHLELGYQGIGYHYVIRRDGSLQRGRPVNLEGEHANVNGHNSRSIGIVFVGGINVPSGTPNIQDFVSVQSLTRSQLNTFDHFCRSFYTVFPGGQGLGHNDLDHDQFDPGFSVRDYVRTNFDKDSLFLTPNETGPFTVDEITKGEKK